MSKKLPANKLKNCENCQHIEYGEYDNGDFSGLFCDQRQNEMTHEQEGEFLKKIQDESFRLKSKVCFKAREVSA